MWCSIPPFRQEEINRLRNQRLDYLRVALQQPGSLARFVTERVVFGSGAYGHATGGTLETVQTISRDNIATLYRRITCRRTQPSFWQATLPLGAGERHSPKSIVWRLEERRDVRLTKRSTRRGGN